MRRMTRREQKIASKRLAVRKIRYNKTRNSTPKLIYIWKKWRDEHNSLMFLLALFPHRLNTTKQTRILETSTDRYAGDNQVFSAHEHWGCRTQLKSFVIGMPSVAGGREDTTETKALWIDWETVGNEIVNYCKYLISAEEASCNRHASEYVYSRCVS